MTSSPIESPIDRAIRIAGGQRKLAQLIGVSYQAIQKFRRRVPAEQAIPIERATDGQVKRHQLRPDIYPPDEYQSV
jgi:DNA-binding transcriptional regulator YdaS (Cro superfamily)